MIDPLEFLHSLISDHWNDPSFNAPKVDYVPAMKTSWFVTGDPLPLITFTKGTSPLVETHGLPGKVHYSRFAVRISIWHEISPEIFKMARMVIEAIVRNASRPKTKYYDNPEICFLQVTNEGQNFEDTTMSPSLHRQDVIVLAHYQDCYL